MSSLRELLSSPLNPTIKTAGYVSLEGCISFGDAIKKILQDAENSAGASHSKKHADTQAIFVAHPLNHLIFQQCNTRRDEYVDKKDRKKLDEVHDQEAQTKAIDRIARIKIFNTLCGKNELIPFADEDIIQKRLKQILIETNKDTLSMRPALAFVANNLDKYQEGLGALMGFEPTKEALDFASSINLIGEKDRIEPQIRIQDARMILARMPEILIRLSQLETIDFHFAKNPNGEGYPIIPVPIFDEQGVFNGNIAQLKPSDFPRKNGVAFEYYLNGIPKTEIATEVDHTDRILVGISNGRSIFPTPIPHSLSDNPRAIEIYQICVFVHEFFHTVESQYRKRKGNNRHTIKLKHKETVFTLQDWWEEWENLLLSGREAKSVSFYASTYNDKLTPAMQENGRKGDWKFEYAIAEQIAESFVAYIFNIQANPDGWTDFRSESFGNTEQMKKYQSGESPAANEKWLLLDKLCRSVMVK